MLGRAAAAAAAVALLLLLAGCASGFDAKAQANSLGVDRGRAAASAPASTAAASDRPPLSREPFALVRRRPEADVLGALPPNVSLPFDAHVEQGRETGVIGGTTKFTHRTLQVRIPGSYARFDRDAGDVIATALQTPPDIAVVFRYENQYGIGTYNAMAVESKPLATTADLEKAEVIPWGKDNVSVSQEETKLVAVRVTFREDVAQRLEVAADSPVAFLLHGRVVRKDDRLGTPDGRAVRLIFEWPDLKEARETAEGLVALIVNRPGT